MKQKGFLASLFDFSFRHFITVSYLKFIFVLSLFTIGIMFLIGIVPVIAAIALLPKLGIVVFALYVCLLLGTLISCRLGLEVTVVYFRIQEHTRRLAVAQGFKE